MILRLPKEFPTTQPVHKSTLPSLIVENVVQAIKKGELKQGDRLSSTATLAKKLNVGQGSVREALKQLQVMGVVNVRHGKGVFVSEVNIGSVLKDVSHLLILKRPDILYLMEARKIVENGTVRLAAQRASQEEIKELYQFSQRMQSELDDPESFIKDDLDFHLRLAEASKNPILPTFLNSVRSLFLEEQKAVVRLPGAAKRASNYHVKIYEAIKEHDAEKAAKVMTNHLTNIEKTILQYHSGSGTKKKLLKVSFQEDNKFR